MRYAKTAFSVAFALLLTGLFSPSARAEVSFGVFYSNLSPYGSWHVSGQYGRVWQPVDYASGWNPYYDGHWVYTDLGWTWVSDYEWGAIPYHYGTWVPDPDYGWVWVPGYTWAPAWVVFRTGPDYIGWAPVSPGFSVGVSASFGEPAPGPFVFVSAGNFLAPRVRTCIVPRSRTTVIINNTRIVNSLVVENNVVVNRGPDRRLIERASGRSVREVPIERVSRVTAGPRATRAEFRVDPQRVRHGLRVAEPVSANTPLPVVRPREARSEERRGARSTTAGPTANSPRAPRRLAEQRGRRREETVVEPHDEYPAARGRTRANDIPATTQVGRAPSRSTPSFRQREGEIARRRGIPATTENPTSDAPRAPRRITSEKTTRWQGDSQRAYREYPGGQYKVQRTVGSDTRSPRRVSPGEMGSIRPPTRAARPDRAPTAAAPTRARQNAQPARGERPAPKQGKKPHDSGKD